MKIDGILFDKDDTLIDLTVFWRKPVRLLAEYICNYANCTAVQELEYAAGFYNGKLLPESPVAAGTNEDVVNACFNVLNSRGIFPSDDFKTVCGQYLENVCVKYGEVKGNGDFDMLLPKLKERGIRLGVATSDSYKSTMHCLEKLGVQDYFDAVLTADRVKKPKPSPEIINKFCSLFNIKPCCTAVVGDCENDMIFAKNGNAVGVFFKKEFQENMSSVCDFKITDLREILNIAD